ncbi:hypothetical protein AB4480_16805 [Vibrio sp. 10N.261.45.A4]|uniref:hypothetical protein n=1 Tax=Vibrio sp. 10N.261.45.A4 TaxID=3229655 RepID=UPI00354F0A2C
MIPKIYCEIEDQNLIEFINENDTEFRSDFKVQFDSLEKKLELISFALQATSEMDRPHLYKIWNLLGYINTCLFDLAVTAESIMFESNQWKKRYHSRMAVLNMYEASLDVPNMFGKDFRLSLKGVDGGESFLVSLGVVIKRFNKFKSDNAAWLKNIRLNMAAHRDQILDEQLAVVFTIDPMNILKSMTEFSLVLKDLEETLNKGTHLV